MANDEQLKILRSGPDAWNEWRSNNRRTTPDLSRAALSGAELREAHLNGADLDGAILYRAKLNRANLSGANLRGADLRSANLFGADLIGNNLWDAELSGADLSGAELDGADLARVDLSGANLRGAHLNGANLLGADLTGADFSGATAEAVTLGHTHLIDVDLTLFVNSEVRREGPCHVDHQSIARSLHSADLLHFLLKMGMPHTFATYAIDSMRSLDPNGLLNFMHSTFISYGGPDEPFAMRLQESLQANGVTTFLFKKDAVPGDALSDVMRGQVREKDRVVLICSGASLDRTGVLNEIELTLRREAREGGNTLLIPIAIDRYAYEEWHPKNESLKEAILERVIGDFVGADTEQMKFDQGIAQLMRALRISR